MYINREKAIQMALDGSTKRFTASTHETLVAELHTAINVTRDHLLTSIVEKAANWLLFQDLWLQNDQKTLRDTYRNYSRGDIILSLDLGTANIGTEIRYPHPCVVLYDQGEDWVVVVPITAASIDRVTKLPIVHEPFEILIEAQKKSPRDSNEFWFKKDSVIQVDQIQRVSKYRCCNKNSRKLRESLLNAIDNKILEFYLPKKHQLFERLKEELRNRDLLLDQWRETVLEVGRQNEELTKKVADLEFEVRKAAQTNQAI